MPLAGFEPAIPANHWPQTLALDCLATGIIIILNTNIYNSNLAICSTVTAQIAKKMPTAMHYLGLTPINGNNNYKLLSAAILACYDKTSPSNVFEICGIYVPFSCPAKDSGFLEFCVMQTGKHFLMFGRIVVPLPSGPSSQRRVRKHSSLTDCP